MAWVALGLSEPLHESVSLECAFSGYMTLTPPFRGSQGSTLVLSHVCSWKQR